MSIFVLPESSRRVLAALSSSGNLSLKSLKEKTVLPERTLRFAIYRLKERGLVSEFITFSDRRRKVFALRRVFYGR